MADNIVTKQFSCEGGLITYMDSLQQGQTAPGSAIKLINYEPMSDGGYQRIQGFSKFDENLVPGTGVIRGLAIIGQYIIACRGVDIYRSNGSGWTKINGTTEHTGSGYYHFATYNFGSSKIVGVDGSNLPFSVDTSGIYTQLTNAPAGASTVTEYKGRLWFGTGSMVRFGAPLTDNDFTVAAGAGEINFGAQIQSLKGWRDQLVIFGTDRIQRVTGDTKDTFVLKPITLSLGCTHPETVEEVGGDLVFLAADGLRTIAGTDKQDGFNVDNIARNIQKPLLDLRKAFPRIVSVVVKAKQQLRILGSSETRPISTSMGYLGVIRGVTADWEWAQTLGIKATVAYSGQDLAGEEVVVFGNDSGYIYLMESGDTFDGGTVPATYQTPFLVFEDVNIRKVFRRLTTFMKSEKSYNIDVQLILDLEQIGVPQPGTENLGRTQDGIPTYGTSTYGASIYGGISTPVTPVQLTGTGFSGSLLFRSDDTNPPHSIQSLAIDVTMKGRK